jgi:hypothetical protein
MNGEVQLIVKVPGTAPSGIVTAVESGVLDATVNSQVAFSYPNDMSAYVGGYVQIQSPVYGDLGTYFIESVALDNPAYAFISPTNTQLFSNVPWNFAINNFDLPNFNYMEAIPSTTDCYLDLFENESISQNWKFQDLSNFTAQGAFSREFRVPYSETNQKALGALFDVNVSAGTENYFHYKLPAEIRVDTLPIATGYVRVRKVYKQMGRINEVELAFYAETPDLVRNIGEKKLADIGALSSLNETVNYVNVTNPNANRIWTILDRGQLWSEGGEANTRRLTLSTQPVYAADLTPAISWWWLFEKIISEAGFELAAGSLENILETYWMPWLNSQNLLTSSNFNAYNFQAYPTAQTGINDFYTLIPVNTELYDNNNDFDTATYTYIASAGGIYNFRAIVEFTNILPNPVDIIIALSINGSTAFNEMYIGDIGLGTSVVNTTQAVPLVAGDTVQLKVKQGALPSNAFVFVEPGDGTTNSTFFTVESTDLFYGQTMFYELNAPDMKQIDLVTDVIKMHNCAIVPDRTVPNKIYIVPQNSYLGSGDTLDWTPKLDISKDITISSTVDIQKAKFQFTYTAGEDITSKVYKNVNRIYGDYEAVGYTINPNTLPSDFAIGDQKIQLVTQSTPSGVLNGSGYVMPLFYNENLEFVAPGPRCLFEAGSVNIKLFRDSALTVVTEAVPVLNNYSQVNADIDDEDLNWAPEVPPHAIVANPYNNLFNKYWRSYMNALYSPDGRIMEAFFALDLKDILTFKFSDKVWIQDSYWRILEITDYKVGNYESTKVKLLKIVEESEDCASTPASVKVNGEVNFIDANGDPVAPTQDCCQRYGYDWDETTGVCWAFTLTGGRPLPPTSGNATNPAPRVNKTAIQTRSILNSTINGEDVTIIDGNKDMLAVGQQLELTKNVSGSNLLGKNVITNLPGIHVGGGYRDGLVNSSYLGWAQFGQFVLQKKFNVATSGDVFDLDIEGVAGEYINMIDNTAWSVIMNVTIKDALGAVETSLHHFTLDKYAGVANASAITTLSTIGAIGTNVFTFGIDTITFTDEHRINVTVTGGTYPDDFIVAASIQYQQIKIS